MAIAFNNIPDTLRTPGSYAEVDNSRALTGLIQNPHVALIIGQKSSTGTVPVEVLKAVTSDGLADGFFGVGSILARMCNKFKENNPNTELFALALSNDGGTLATGLIKFASGLSTTAATTYYLLVNGQKVYTTLNSGWSVTDICSAVNAKVNSADVLPLRASVSASAAGSNHVALIAKNSGTLGNQIDVRANYYVGQNNPAGFSAGDITYSAMSGGATDPDLADAWAVIAGKQFHYVVHPYTDASNLAELEGELSERFKPLIDLQGHGFTSFRGTLSDCSTKGNSRNNPHSTIHGLYDAPTGPEEIAAALGAQCAFNLNIDPARPLHTLQLKGVLAPPVENRFSRAERDILLFDGISTNIYDTSDNVLIERVITTYQTNALGIPDPSYLDVETLATLGEIRFQYKVRMVNRFIVPRMKLADNTYPVSPGSKVVTPRTVKQEIIALFSNLQEIGLIENLEEMIENLRVERNLSDRNRVDVLLPPDLVNQFRVLATIIQFVL
jgi:phage tail sheath gpL-like